LILEQIPTAKQFRDAIESLSPEQQAFAKAFRSMQLESTLFGICIIQIKPQLEKLLNLPNDSLTKEIELTQDLQELFITYQIPSDLISYAGNENSSIEEKLEAVKNHVSALQEMLNQSKQEEIFEEKQRRDYEGVEKKKIKINKTEKSDKKVSREKKIEFKKEKKKSFKGKDSKAKVSASKVSAESFVQLSTPQPSTPQPSTSTPETTSVDATPTKEPSLEVTETTEDVSMVDYTKIPAQLDAIFEVLDDDNAIHPTIINIGLDWTKKFQKGLLTAPETTNLNVSNQESERNRAFDLLDALSKSGVLPVDEASLHVVIASTHCFDKTLMKTVIQDNINPIEKVERSTLIVASAIHQLPTSDLIKLEHQERVRTSSPKLFVN